MTEAFTSWLTSRGRAAGTARVYSSHVEHAMALPGGPIGRVTSKRLAPKTRRSVLAALRAWARFKGDTKLLALLDDVSLPPADRLRPRVPLSIEQWGALREKIRHTPNLDEATRASLGILAARGLRIGDVVRIQRVDVLRALKHEPLSLVVKRGKRIEINPAPIARELKALASFTGWSVNADLLTRSRGKNKHESAKQALSRAFRHVADEAGLPDCYPHQLRRTYASHFLREMQGDPEAMVKLKLQLGWTNVQTAFEYVDHERREELDEIEAKLHRRMK